MLVGKDLMVKSCISEAETVENCGNHFLNKLMFTLKNATECKCVAQISTYYVSVF